MGSKGCFFFTWYGLFCFFFLSKIIDHAMFRLWVIWWIKFYLMSFGFRALFSFYFFSCFILTEMFKAYDFFWNICDDLLSLFVILWCFCFDQIKNISCVLHTANTLTCFECSFFFIQKILEVLKMCFHMDFLNTQKNLFSCISGIYNMFVKLQRVLANIPKNIKILFWGELIYYSPLMFG